MIICFRAKPTRLGKLGDQKVFKDPKSYVKVRSMTEVKGLPSESLAHNKILSVAATSQRCTH